MTRRSFRHTSVLLASLVGSLALVRLTSAGPAPKVNICHFPPGNPANYQTITIGAAALPAHLAHGDFPGSCANDCKLFGSVCDDDNACTTDTCNADGTCAHSTATNCDDGNVCTADSCNPTTGVCVNTPKTGLTYCDDSNDCTLPDTCTNSGTCRGMAVAGCCNTSADCDDLNLCTSDVCTNRTCSNTSVTCTPPDKCADAACNPLTGACVSAAKSCDDGDACTVDSCNLADGTCQHPAGPILDFNIPGGTGTASYAGGNNPLVGSGIALNTVSLLPDGPFSVPCVGCTLDFATGNFASATSTEAVFSGGGSITITGSVPAAGASGVLLSGLFDNVVVERVAGTFRVVIAVASDTKSAGLLAFFGLPNQTYAAGLNLAFQSSIDVFPPTAFSSSVVLSGDLANSDPVCSEPN